MLLARSAVGDHDAFAQFYDRFAGAVFGLCHRLADGAGPAERLTTEIFTDAWRRCGEFDASSGSASTWLMDLAHERAVGEIRGGGDQPASVVPRPRPVPKAVTIRSGLLAEVYFDARTYREVAVAHGLSPDQVAQELTHDLREAGAARVG